MDHATWFGVELDARWDLPAVVPALAAEIVAPHSWVREATMPDDGESPGRALCRLHCTMQC